MKFYAKNYFFPDMDICVLRNHNNLRDFRNQTISYLRDYWIITLITGGSGIIQINHAEKPLSPGIVYILRPEDIVQQQLSTRIDLLQVLFHRKFLNRLGLDFGTGDFLAGLMKENYAMNTGNFPINQRVFPSTPEIRHLMKRMLWEFDHQYGDTEQLLRLNLAILILLLKAQSKRSFRHRLSADSKEKIMSFLAENIQKEPDWTMLAEELGISQSYLLKNFKRITGCSPVQAVQKARLKEAAHLLRDTSLPLQEIQCRSGMTSFSMLYRLFTREYGIPPGKYRESNPPEKERPTKEKPGEMRIRLRSRPE